MNSEYLELRQETQIEAPKLIVHINNNEKNALMRPELI